MPRTSVGWTPSRHAVFPTRTAPLGRAHPIRDPRGRFALGTPVQRLESDIAEAQRQFQAQAQARGPEFGVFQGRLSRRPFAIRRGVPLPLDAQQVRATIQGMSRSAARIMYQRVVATSPVDTGLLRSQWRLEPNAVTNNVPYVPQTEFVNRSSRGYIRRALQYTLRQIARRSRRRGRRQPSIRTVRLFHAGWIR